MIVTHALKEIFAGVKFGNWVAKWSLKGFKFGSSVWDPKFVCHVAFIIMVVEFGTCKVRHTVLVPYQQFARKAKKLICQCAMIMQ